VRNPRTWPEKYRVTCRGNGNERDHLAALNSSTQSGQGRNPKVKGNIPHNATCPPPSLSRTAGAPKLSLSLLRLIELLKISRSPLHRRRSGRTSLPRHTLEVNVSLSSSLLSSVDIQLVFNVHHPVAIRYFFASSINRVPFPSSNPALLPPLVPASVLSSRPLLQHLLLALLHNPAPLLWLPVLIMISTLPFRGLVHQTSKVSSQAKRNLNLTRLSLNTRSLLFYQRNVRSSVDLFTVPLITVSSIKQ
jgi:hypothetical protein